MTARDSGNRSSDFPCLKALFAGPSGCLFCQFFRILQVFEVFFSLFSVFLPSTETYRNTGLLDQTRCVEPVELTSDGPGRHSETVDDPGGPSGPTTLRAKIQKSLWQPGSCCICCISLPLGTQWTNQTVHCSFPRSPESIRK